MRLYRKINPLLVSATLLALTAIPGSSQNAIDAADDVEAKDRVYIPTDLDDAVRVLSSEIGDDDKRRIKEGEINPIDLHLGLGMSLRNRWGLWAGSRLADFFRSNGIGHPDSMSGYIIQALFRELRGEGYDLLEMMRDEGRKHPVWHAGIIEDGKMAEGRYQAILYERLDYNEKNQVEATGLAWHPDNGRIYLIKGNSEPRLATAKEIADFEKDEAHWKFSHEERKMLNEWRDLSKGERLGKMKELTEEQRRKLDNILPREKDPEGIDKIVDPFATD